MASRHSVLKIKRSFHTVGKNISCLLFFVGCFAGTSLGTDVCKLEPIPWNPTAKARFGLSINLRKSERSDCGLIVEENLQLYVAAQWVAERMNRDNGNGSFVPGVEIGFDVLDDCNSPTRAVHYALDYADCGTTPNTTHVLRIGMIGPMVSSIAEETVYSMRTVPFPIISPSATLASLSDETPNPNFFRTVPSDNVQIAAIIAVLKELGWTFIAVIHSDDNYGTKGSRALQQLAAPENICINASLVILDDPTVIDSILSSLIRMRDAAKGKSLGVVYIGHDDVAFKLILSLRSRNIYGLHFIMSDYVNIKSAVFDIGAKIALGSLTLAPSSVVLKDFEEYLNDKYKKVLNGTESDLFIETFLQEAKWKEPLTRVTPSVYVPLVVEAIFALAEATRLTHVWECEGVPGVCEQLTVAVQNGAILARIHNVSVDFSTMDTDIAPREFMDINYTIQFDRNGDIVPRPGVPDYVIYAYSGDPRNKFIKVGNFSGGQLALNMSQVQMSTILGSATTQVQSSVCSGSCQACVNSGYIPLAHLPGTVYIIGIFSMHTSQSSGPLSCGGFRNTSYDVVAVEAFLHSIEKLRKTTRIDFGAIAFDDCYNPLRLTNLLSNYFSGLVSCESVFEVCIPHEKVFGVVGPLSSGSSLQVAGYFTPLHVPVISYSASSPDLDDSINFPYFLRTVPSDDEQAKAMAEVVLTMGWKYVGLLHVNNNYGAKGANAFQIAARERGLCVAEKVKIPEFPTIADELELMDIIVTLTKQQVKVVIFFGIDSSILAFLHLIESKGFAGRFIFIGSENWGTNAITTGAAPKSTLGSITFKVDTLNIDPGIKESFKGRLLSKTPSQTDSNPWFSEFWQNVHGCNIPGGFNNVFSKECDRNLHFSAAQIDTMLQDESVSHVINAVSALVAGLERARELPNCEGRLPCDSLRTEKFAAKVYDIIRNQRITVHFLDEELFDEDGNGNLGFTIYNIQKDGNIYKPVGFYTRQRGLTLQKDQVLFYTDTGQQQEWTAQCLDTLCSNCPVLAQNTKGTPTERDTFIVVILVIVVIVLAIGLTIMIAIYLIYRRIQKSVHSIVYELKSYVTKLLEFMNSKPTLSEEQYSHISVYNGSVVKAGRKPPKKKGIYQNLRKKNDAYLLGTIHSPENANLSNISEESENVSVTNCPEKSENVNLTNCPEESENVNLTNCLEESENVNSAIILEESENVSLAGNTDEKVIFHGSSK